MARSKRGGHPGGELILADNPTWEGKEVKPPGSYEFCHDGTPYMAVKCACGGENHIHLGQIEGAPDDYELAMRCAECKGPILTTVGFIRDGIREAWKLDGS